jgi:pimeloyl-ACP methyl ester carboxylesterase
VFGATPAFHKGIFMRHVIVWFASALAALFAGTTEAVEARLATTPCSVAGASELLRCASLEIPEDWRRPSGRKLSLHLLILPKLGAGPEQAPMLWLEGGPGVPGTISAPLYAGDLKFHRQRRAVILFDQRGTGASGALHCPMIETRSPLADVWPPADVSKCRRELEARADLTRYSTEASAHDLEAIRSALGYDRIDLAGLSYGTYLAQAYVKLYPTRVRSVVLIGTVPLGEKLPLHHAWNGQLALRQLLVDCRADGPCHVAFPHLEADWAALRQRLARGAITIATEKGPLVVRQGPFGEMVRSALNSVDGKRGLPLLISHAAARDYAPLAQAVRSQGADPGADGLYLSVTCPEGTRRIQSNEIEPATRGSDFGRYRIDQQIVACRLWPRATPDPRLLTQVRANIPVLLLSGGRDATTPSAWARRVAATLGNSRVVIIPAMTHLPAGLDNMECLDRMMDAFFATASARELDTSCVATMSPPPFATSPDAAGVHIQTGEGMSS